MHGYFKTILTIKLYMTYSLHRVEFLILGSKQLALVS